jgi:penicillin amidase
MHRRALLADPQLSTYLHDGQLALGSNNWAVNSSIAGMPALLIGRNEYVATAVTNGYGDSQDLYIETPDPENPEHYLEGDISIPFDVIEETLKVKDKKAADGFRHETIRIRLTKRGPVVSGRLPIRSQRESTLPYPVLDGTDNWTGWIPFEEMPHSYNPSRGWVGSANHKVVDDDYPYYYSSYFSHSYRYRRLRELLGSESVKDVSDHWQYQRDTRNMLTISIAPLMARALLDHADTEQLGQILSDWDLQDDTDLAAPVVFHSVYGEFAKLVFEDELGTELTAALLGNPYFWQERLGQMIVAGRSTWFDDIRTEDISEDLAALFHNAATLILGDLTQSLGENPAEWRWGDVHQIEFTSPLRRRGVGKDLLGAGSHPFPGSGETLHRGIYNFTKPFDTTISASLRMVVDLGDTDKILAVLPGGQSGRLFDAHRNDQVDDFLSGHKRYWWFSDQKIGEHTESELTLLP